jgi:AbrB family looped-hinge helix DNA binding protein
MQVKRRLGPKGQIVLPKDIREMLGVKPGNEIILEVTGDEVKIRPSNKPETYFDRFGYTSRKLTKIVDIKKILEEEYP